MVDETSEEHIELLQKMNEVMLEQIRNGENVTEATFREWKEKTKLGKAIAGLAGSAKSVASGFTASASAVASSTGDFNSMSSAMTGTIKAVTGVISAMNDLVGEIPFVGGAVEAMGDLTISATNFLVAESQKGFEAFQLMSRAGQIGADGIEGMAERMEAAHLPLALFSKIVSENSKNLAYFSSTALDGGKAFSKTMEQMASDAGMPLRRLGFSVEEIGETIIDFQKLNQQMTGQQIFSQEELRKKSLEYGKELDLISRLTGMERKEVQKGVEAAMSDARFRAKIVAMEAEGKTKEAKELTFLVTTLKESSPQFARALMDMTSGIKNSEASQRAMISGVDGALEESLHLIEAGGKTGDAMNIISDKAAEMAKAGGVQQVSAGVYESGQSPFILFNEMVDVGAIATKNQTKATNAQTTAAKKATKQTEDIINANRSLQDAAAGINKLTIASPAAAQAINIMAGTINEAVDYIEKAVNGDTSIGDDIAAVAGDLVSLSPVAIFGNMFSDFFTDSPEPTKAQRTEKMAAGKGLTLGPDLSNTVNTQKDLPPISGPNDKPGQQAPNLLNELADAKKLQTTRKEELEQYKTNAAPGGFSAAENREIASMTSALKDVATQIASLSNLTENIGMKANQNAKNLTDAARR